MLGGLSTRGRIMVVTGLAASPLVALVAFSAASRYESDREFAETRATARAELIATLLAEDGETTPPSPARLDHLLRLGALSRGTTALVYRDGRPIVRAGAGRAEPPAGDRDAAAALEGGSGVFQAEGADGVDRVWGVRRVGDGPLTLAYGLPGHAVYGPARSALRRDTLLALATLIAAVLAAYMLAGRVTTPIRRLAARIGHDDEADGPAGELGAIERGVLRQASERIKLEDRLRQAQKMEAVGQLAGGVAHDFNNLLTVIKGYGEIARRHIGVGPGAKELAEIERAAERATQLTRQLLAFARRQVLEPVPLELNEVTRSLAPMLGRLIGEDIRVAMLLGDDLPPVVADRGQLEQVIINLAINARDAMPTGGTLTLETRELVLDEEYVRDHGSIQAGRHVCLVVTDTGAGIAPEHQEHIFEPFYTTKGVGHGTGLGLATVHGIVSQSGGHVEVYSEPGLGSTFKVYLPAADAAERPRGAPGDRRPEQLGGSESILVCEDEESVRSLIVDLLSAEGYRVRACGRPQEAIELAMAPGTHVDLLITDVILPGISGPELAAKLERDRPGLRTLFLSGYTFETVRDRGNLPPGSSFLEKPFDRDSLLRQVRGLLDRSPARPYRGRRDP